MLILKTRLRQGFDACKRTLASGLRRTPGISTLLRLPGRPVRCLETWISQQRSAVSWAQRGKLPWIRILHDATIETRRPPGWDAATDETSAEFHHERHHSHDRLFLAHLPEASILGPTGLVLTDTRQPIEESILLGRLESDAAATRFSLPWPECLSGHYYTIASLWTKGYAHWLLDALPRLHALDLVSNKDVRIIVPESLNEWQRDSLSALGIDPTRCVSLNNRHLKVQGLYVPSFLGTTGNPHRRGMQWLRKRFLGDLPPVECSERIYISRRSASRRRVSNEQELEPILLRHGFQIIECERLSFIEQIDLFRRASVVIGLHGAGLANLLFAPQGCRVLEILTPQLRNRLMYYSIASDLELEYAYLMAGDMEQRFDRRRDNGFDDAAIDPELLSRQLAVLDNARSNSVPTHNVAFCSEPR